MAGCLDVIADKLHPRFDTKVLSKKGVAYMLVFMVNSRS